jgi:hypothetical protein
VEKFCEKSSEPEVFIKGGKFLKEFQEVPPSEFITVTINPDYNSARLRPVL